MGEYADAILDGESCQMCGADVPHANGFPTYCTVRCAKDHGATKVIIDELREAITDYKRGNS